MTKFLFALLAMFCVCSASADICKTNSSIVKIMCDLNECQGYIKKTIDSVSNKAISNDISIKIQESNNDIVLRIIIVISILLSSGSAYVTYRSRKSIKNIRQEFENWTKKQKEDFEKEIENINKKINSANENFANIKNIYIKAMDSIKDFEKLFEKQRGYFKKEIEDINETLSKVEKISSEIKGLKDNLDIGIHVFADQKAIVDKNEELTNKIEKLFEKLQENKSEKPEA